MKQISMNNETSFEQLFNIFLTSRKAFKIQERTAKTYQGHFLAFKKYLDVSKDISLFSQKDIDQMVIKMQTSGLASNSIKTYLSTLRTFFNWCAQEQLSTLTIQPYKADEIVKEPYTDEELTLLLKKPNLKHCLFTEYRDWVIVNFLLNSGCRAATIRAIQIRDLDLDQGLVYYRHSKNRKMQVIPLCSQMISILEEYLRYRKGNPEDALFCTKYGEPLMESGLRKAIVSYNHSRGVQKTSIHLFRHTFAKKFLLDCNGDAFTLQKILGHSSLDMTKHYCSIYNADIIKNYDNISPLELLSQKQKTAIKINK